MARLRTKAENGEFEELLSQARPPERTVPLCLRGDLVAEFEDLDRLRAEVGPDVGDSLAGSTASAIARQIEDLREQIQAATVTFRVQALPRPAYQALAAAHPPRRDADGNVLVDDVEHGVNDETFWFALTRASVIEPELDDAQWARLVDEVLSDRQFEVLAIAALTVSRGSVDIPFSSAASRLLNVSGGESRPQNGSGSPSAGSTAGRPKRSTSTTNTGG